MTKITIDCYLPALGTSTHRIVEATIINDVWAIHDVASPASDGYEWSLTHRLSGRALAWFRSESDAAGMARWLDDPGWSTNISAWGDLPEPIIERTKRALAELGAWTPEREDTG